MSYSNQKKGMLIAFTGIMFITPDSLFIRLANINSWNLIFYRGFIPFLIVLLGLLILYKEKLFREINITDNKFLNREPGVILSPLDCCNY